jgi:hypothetical protein
MEGYPLIYGWCGHNSGNNNIYIYIHTCAHTHIYIYIYMPVHIMMTLITNNSDYTMICK